MDCSEATNIVLTKIKNLDPENASKIMGFLLISLEESELVRLCSFPDHVLHSLVLRAKSQLCLSTNSVSTAIPSPPSPLNPIARPTASSNPFSQSSPRIGDNGLSSPSSHCWPFSGFPNSPISPKSSTLLSYKNIRSGFPNDPTNVKDFLDEHQMSDYLSFLNESSSKNEDLVDPQLQSGHGVNNWQPVNNGDVVPFHRRCFSASDVCFDAEEGGSGIGHKLCLYYARGHCKNGSNCKFVHGVLPDSMDAPIVRSPSGFDVLEQRVEFERLKAIQQRMMASPRLTAGLSMSPSSHDQYLNFLMQQQIDRESQRAGGALMMGEEFIPFGRGRPERNDFSVMASAERLNSASRQIYLTFPAESTFKDEDVSEYFSQFGPVQDVRIPYQQKRMFGFVTFVYPETVRLILAKGNPHFICDSRVLVKPYKEKGKAPEKRQHHQQQQFDRGDFSPSLSPMGFDAKEPYDHHGGRMFCSPQEILLRRQLEQHELNKAIELQGRRLMNLQLPDFKNNPIHHHHRSLSVGSSLPITQPNSNISNADLTPDSVKGDITGYNGTQASTVSLPTATLAEMQQKQEDANQSCTDDNVGRNKKDNTNAEVSDKNLEKALPDSLSASPTNAAGDLPNSSALPGVNESTAFSTSSSPQHLEPPA